MREKKGTKWVTFLQRCEVHFIFFLCSINYSSVEKGMSALSVIDQNLEVVSQRE